MHADDGDLVDVEPQPASPDDGEPIAEAESPYVPLASGQGSLVKSDLLSRYLADVARHDRLEADEEHELAVKYHVEKDHAAAARLVSSHLRLVVSIAFSFRRAFSNVLDLIQEGNVGLMEAVQRFDPYKGTRLSTYATWWIRSRIVRYLLDNWRLVRVGTTNARRKLLYNLRDEKERLERMGVRPTPKLLADNLGVTQEDVVAVDQAIGASDVSIDAPVSADGPATFGELLPGQEPTPEDDVAASAVLEKLHQVLGELETQLSPREKVLLRTRLLAEDPVTLQSIAGDEGVSREAVRQSESRLLDKLRDWLEEKMPEASDIHLGRL